jgi:hypothetical protein
MRGDTPESAKSSDASTAAALEKLALLRYAAGTITVSLASGSFGRAVTAQVGASEALTCVKDVQALAHISFLPPLSDKDWYSAALNAISRRCDALLAVHRPSDADRIDPTSVAEIRALDVALRGLLTHGGHRPLDVIRRSMQHIYPLDASHAAGNAAASPVRLFISGKIAAGCPALLDFFGVTHVVTCFATGASIDVGSNRDRLVLPCVDDDVYDLTQDFETATQFFSAAVAKAAAARTRLVVLVHCAAGMHRCTVIAAAIMVRVLGCRLDAALAFIKAARPMAEPTGNFKRQLDALAASLDADRASGPVR